MSKKYVVKDNYTENHAKTRLVYPGNVHKKMSFCGSRRFVGSCHYVLKNPKSLWFVRGHERKYCNFIFKRAKYYYSRALK